MTFITTLVAASIAVIIPGCILNIRRQLAVKPLIYVAKILEANEECRVLGHQAQSHSDSDDNRHAVWIPKEGSERIFITTGSLKLIAIGFATALISSLSLHNPWFRKPEVKWRSRILDGVSC